MTQGFRVPSVSYPQKSELTTTFPVESPVGQAEGVVVVVEVVVVVVVVVVVRHEHALDTRDGPQVWGI